MDIFTSAKEELDLEFFLDRESIHFRTTRGRSGLQLNVRECPVDGCNDNRYRVYLNADSGAGNCFVCNTKFNKLSFIKHCINGTWPQVARYCEEILREQGWRPKKRIEAAVDPGQVQLPISLELPLPEGNLGYLETRGIDAETARYFHLRYCEFGFWRYKNSDGEYKVQLFDNRIIIPVYDLDGSLKTYQGRDITGASDRKYLFPKELPGTGRYLLNGHNFTVTKHAVLGEGFFDVAAIKIAFESDPQLINVLPIGSFGKHLSYGDVNGDDQLGRFIQLKHRGLETVTIMWDGEANALIAALDAAKILSRVGIKVRIALLPFEKDPNEVSAQIVRAAYYKAETWTPMLDAKLRLRNPYRSNGGKKISH